MSEGHTERHTARRAKRQATKRDEAGTLWFAVVVALVFLLTVVATALILGPSGTERELRFERPSPSIPNEPKLPEPPRLPRQVA